MSRHLVLTVALMLIIAFAVLFGYGALVAMSGQSALAPIVGSLVVGVVGVCLLHWHRRLDYRHSLRQFS